jgi:regulatory protein
MEYKEALNKAAALCSRAEKCKYDIEKKFADWGLMTDKIEEGLAYLVKEKFIDENRYAKHFVHDKFRFNHWGKIKIAYALRQKNISQKDISNAMNEIQDSEYRDTLLDILKSKIRTIKSSSSYELKAKLMRFAQSRGFETELINAVAEEVLKQCSE